MTEPYELTIAQAASQIRSGSLSPVELTNSLLARSSTLDPQLNVWRTLDEDAAHDAAAESARQLADTGPAGPLHGIPFGVKDIFYTRGVETTGCSKVYEGFVPEFDSTAVALLKRAGGIMLGKTVTTEFAMFEPPPTKNPWNFDRTPGGSSSGSAAGTAARMFPMALGSQTAGSVLRPAAYNGVVGIKPTLGLVSRYGVMPVSWSLDTMGWFTRTVEDAAIILGVLAQHDPNDNISLSTPATDYTASLNAVNRPRIGFMRQYFVEDATPEVQDHVDHAVAKLIEAGASVEEVRIPIDMHAGREAHGFVQNAEAADAHEDDFAAHADDYMPTTRGVIENGMAVPVTKYIQAQALRRDLRRELLQAVEPYDAILTPSTLAPAPDTTTTGNPACQWTWTTVGFPAISIPSGLSKESLPLGIQLASAPLDEATLLSIAAWCEQVLDVELIPPV